MAYTLPIKFASTGRYGSGPDDEDDVYTVDEFLECVKCGEFIDYDGFGYAVKGGLADKDKRIVPSKAREAIPPDATHVVWFNR